MLELQSHNIVYSHTCKTWTHAVAGLWTFPPTFPARPQLFHHRYSHHRCTTGSCAEPVALLAPAWSIRPISTSYSWERKTSLFPSSATFTAAQLKASIYIHQRVIERAQRNIGTLLLQSRMSVYMFNCEYKPVYIVHTHLYFCTYCLFTLLFNSHLYSTKALLAYCVVFIVHL